MSRTKQTPAPMRIRLDMTRSTLLDEKSIRLRASEPQDHPVAQHPSIRLWRTIGCLANDSNASLRRYQKMKYAADNALGILKNSHCYVIVWRQVAQRQRMIGTKLHFRTRRRRHSRYNRYRLTRLKGEMGNGPAPCAATSRLSTCRAQRWRR